jgi:hypothetical protein
MSNLSPTAALLAKQASDFKPASNGGQNAAADAAPIEASFSDVLSQIQSTVTGKPRTGFNGRPGGGIGAITDQAKAAIAAQTKTVVDHTMSAISAAKSLVTPTPKTGFHP